MVGKRRDSRAELRGVLDALADSSFECTDAQVLAEAREEGLDPDAEAARVREILLRAVKKQKLREAQQQYEFETAKLSAKSYQLPTTLEDQRQLLDAVIAAQPQLREMVTVQFRDLRELTAADVERTLRKFDALGLVTPFRKQE